MKYQNIVTTELLLYTELKERYPNVSLAPDGTENITIIIASDPIEEDTWRVIQNTAQPEYDVYTESVVEVAPIDYMQTWSIVPLSTEQINQNIVEAKLYKYKQTQDYADVLVDEANGNPYIGAKTSAAKNKRKVSTRINHASNGKPKNDTDKDRDDELADYSDNVYDAQDSADDIIEDMDDAQAIYDLHVSTMVNWPVWMPPA